MNKGPAPVNPSDALLVLVTAPDTETAARIGRTLVDEGLAACVNVLPDVRSIYRWQGAVHDEPEVLCLIKSRRELYPALRDRVTALHPYQLPEILGLSPSEGNAPYLRWILETTGSGHG
jgi:periplasmic divalent cation tolerance protein